MKICPKCGSQNNDSAKFCYQCGASLSDMNLRCPQCNSVVKQNSKFCPKCGYRFVEIGDCETKSIDVIHGYEEDQYENQGNTSTNQQPYQTGYQQPYQGGYQQPPYQGGYQGGYQTGYQQPYQTGYQQPYQGGYQQPPYQGPRTQTNLNMNGYPGYGQPYPGYNQNKKPYKTKKEVTEVEDNFESTKSKVNKETMEKNESIFNLVISWVSFLAILVSLVFVCVQFVTVSGASKSIWYVMFNQWSDVSELVTGTSSANSLVSYLYPILSFVSSLALLIVGCVFALYTLIKGLINLSKKKYKNRFPLLVLIQLLVFLVTINLFSISNQPIGLTPLTLVSLVLSTLTVLADIAFKIAKSVISGNTTLLIRKILYTVSFALLLGGLFVAIFPTYLINGTYVSLQKALLDFVAYADTNAAGNLAYLLGLIGSILAVLLVISLVLSVIFNYLALTKFNHSKVKVVVFNSISFALALVYFILMIMAITYNYSGVSFVTGLAIVNVALSGVSFVIGLATLIVLKDKAPAPETPFGSDPEFHE